MWDERLHDEWGSLPGPLRRFDPGLDRRLDSRTGWRLRRAVAPARSLLWLATGTPPRRIGYAPGPLLAVRRARQRRRSRPMRICLVEEHRRGTRFAPATAYWLNERSRLFSAVVNEPAGADVVWVLSQDPLEPDVRGRVETLVRALPPGTVVLNLPEVYDAYHGDDAFPRLAAAGVRVPRTDLGAADLGRTPVVYKTAGAQGGPKTLEPYAGERPGYRAFGYVDARNADGASRRYRAFCAAGIVEPTDVIISTSWKASLDTLNRWEPRYDMTDHERDQISLAARTLGLDFFAADYVRRASDGAPVLTDINVYPTMVIDGFVDASLGCRGRWHFLDTKARLGVDGPGPSFWERLDLALETRVAAARSGMERGLPCPR